MNRTKSGNDDLTAIETVARRNGLSSSRFLHLFSEQAGVPYRRYRMWSRLRAARRRHNGRISDSPHFTHNFRDTFGVTPSYVFSKVARAGRSDVMAHARLIGSTRSE
ncbi:MAG TPA: AraC family transcriptional regulator [Burkholderiales bacterium]|nr:AraC family transcriptional regulator [Burkholderiales bacterium]